MVVSEDVVRRLHDFLLRESAMPVLSHLRELMQKCGRRQSRTVSKSFWGMDRMIETTIDEIKRHEAYRSHVYLDTKQVLSIGYGLNLKDGISEPLATKILEWTLEERLQVLRKFPFWEQLSQARQEVFLNMAFNLGIPRFLKFREMLKAAATGDVAGVCQEMTDSKWYREDVGYRAVELVEKFRVG